MALTPPQSAIKDISTWINFLNTAEIPVLKNTAREIVQLQDLVQVEQAILMMGTTSFFKYIPTNFLVEDIPRDDPIALMHLLKLIRRAHRAAYFAADWATHLVDLRAEEVRTAALLHDLAEMLMWCFAPKKMHAIHTMQHATCKQKYTQHKRATSSTRF